MPPDLAALAEHGGDLDAASRLFPSAPQPWLDLSTGLNPIAYPVGDLPPECWARLPTPAALDGLEAAAARRYRVPPGVAAVAAPGTQAIIQQLPALAGGRDVRLLGPTYGEFARVFRLAGARVTVVPSVPALAGADVAVAVNPNNPDGRFVPPVDLLRLAGRVGTLVVDEAFADALPPSCSIVPHLAPEGPVLVLRSFGKMFGLAGLRLGFAVLPAERAGALRRALGPWPVSGPAISTGTRALSNDGWLETARARLRADGARLGYLLAQTGAVEVGCTPLFRLVAHPAAPLLFRELARSGILTRPFADRRDWLRFGLPGPEPEWRRLEAALRAFR